MRPPSSGITITFRYSFSKNTTFHSWGVGSSAIDSEGIIEGLYRYYTAHPETLPGEFGKIVESEGAERAACDYISGMTDGYAMEKYEEIYIPFTWKVK